MHVPVADTFFNSINVEKLVFVDLSHFVVNEKSSLLKVCIQTPLILSHRTLSVEVVNAVNLKTVLFMQ